MEGLVMKKTFLILWVILFIFFASKSVSWSATLGHNSPSTKNKEFTAQTDESKDLQEDLEKQLRLLLKDLEKLEKEAKEKMTKEILPYLRQEIERIKKWLKEFRLEKEDRPERIRI
jgi:peptidoglycan hydrolase CwlO-like protein